MFDDMLEAGVIKHNASLVVLVKKKDKTQSMCISYKGLNAMTIKDKFHIPLIEDLLEELGGARIFTKIDLRASYQQVRMKPEDIHKTAFKTHKALQVSSNALWPHQCNLYLSVPYECHF